MLTKSEKMSLNRAMVILIYWLGQQNENVWEPLIDRFPKASLTLRQTRADKYFKITLTASYDEDVVSAGNWYLGLYVFFFLLFLLFSPVTSFCFFPSSLSKQRDIFFFLFRLLTIITIFFFFSFHFRFCFTYFPSSYSTLPPPYS